MKFKYLALRPIFQLAWVAGRVTSGLKSAVTNPNVGL